MEKHELPVLNTILPESIYFEPRSKSGREERQDASQNRQKVLEAARQLFNSRGVDAVTMSDIAKEAGVGKGTLYRRYPDKGTLCMALVDQTTQDFQDSVLDYLRADGSKASPIEQIGWFFEALVDYLEANSSYLKPSRETGLAFHKTPFYDLPVYQWQRSLMLLFLRDAIAQNIVAPDLDLEYLADAILAPLQVDLYLYQRQVLGYTSARIVAGMRQLLQGLR